MMVAPRHRALIFESSNTVTLIGRTNAITLKNRTLFLFLAVLGILPLAAQTATEAPPAEEIAAAYVETIGGSEAWNKLSSMRMTGKVNMQGMSFPAVITTATGDKNRFEMDIQGNKMVQAYDGEVAWQYFPMQGITEPQPMPDGDAADLKESPFLDVFIDYADRGFQLESVEGREVDGAETYGVRVTNDEGFDRTYYFDTESMVPLLMTFTSRGGQTAGMAMESYLSDYEEVEGLVIPMFMKQKLNGQDMMTMTFDSVVLDPELEENFFSMDGM